MNDQNPRFGNDTALPAAKTPKKTHRVSFDVDSDFLHEAQTVLSDAPKRLDHLATYMELLRDLALSKEYDADDPRLIAAFEIGLDAARMMAARDGQMFAQLFRLMDDDQNIGMAN
jgi:hypothetical protein